MFIALQNCFERRVFCLLTMLKYNLIPMRFFKKERKQEVTPKILFFLLLAIGVMQCSKVSEDFTPLTSERPNILIIVADDLGYYDLGYTGSTFYETPNIDRLAERSFQFSQAYSNSPVCSPARASLMTGQFTSRHGITDWIGALTGDEWRTHKRHSKMLPADNAEILESSHFTLPEAMSDAGYSTFIAGKWHLGKDPSTPESHGFDINVGAWESGSPKGGYFDPYVNPNMDNRSPGEQLSYRLADETLNFVKQNSNHPNGSPFFAYLSFYAVHSPLQTSQAKWKKYRDKADSLGISENGFVMGDYIPVRTVQDHPVYAGLIEHMDEAVGYLLDGLTLLGVDKNTIIIFTSDNGGVSSGDHFSTSNLPLRAGKGSTYEGGIRVPLLIFVPGMEEESKMITYPVTGTDIYPTVLDLTGQALQPAQHVDGISLVPILGGYGGTDRSLIWHYPHYSNQDGKPSGAIRTGEWKLIVDYYSNELELYNLTDDLSESFNLAEQFPERARNMYEILTRHFEKTGVLFPSKDPLYDAAKEETRLNNMRTKRLPNLESQRLQFLSPEYAPDNDWWGSISN